MRTQSTGWSEKMAERSGLSFSVEEETVSNKMKASERRGSHGPTLQGEEW